MGEKKQFWLLSSTLDVTRAFWRKKLKPHDTSNPYKEYIHTLLNLPSLQDRYQWMDLCAI